MEGLIFDLSDKFPLYENQVFVFMNMCEKRGNSHKIEKNQTKALEVIYHGTMARFLSISVTWKLVLILCKQLTFSLISERHEYHAVIVTLKFLRKSHLNSLQMLTLWNASRKIVSYPFLHEDKIFLRLVNFEGKIYLEEN